MNKIKEFIKYNCLFSTAILYLFKKQKIIDKNIIIESIRRKKAKKIYKKYKYVFNNIPLINECDNSYERKIWTCWLQGEMQAPEIVKKCLKSIRKNANDWEVILITKDNFKDYANIPNYIIEKWENGIITNTHFSDILRCALLVQHGGIWMDATCYLSDKIPNFVTKNELFCFKHKYRYEDTIEFGSWFLFSKKNNLLLNTAFTLEKEYWKKEKHLADYFLFHIFIYLSKKYYDDIWNFQPNLSDVYPHELNRLFNEPFDEELYKITINNSFIHKMTYKTSTRKEGSFHDYFLKKGI